MERLARSMKYLAGGERWIQANPSTLSCLGASPKLPRLSKSCAITQSYPEITSGVVFQRVHNQLAQLPDAQERLRTALQQDRGTPRPAEPARPRLPACGALRTYRARCGRRHRRRGREKLVDLIPKLGQIGVGYQPVDNGESEKLQVFVQHLGILSTSSGSPGAKGLPPYRHRPPSRQRSVEPPRPATMPIQRPQRRGVSRRPTRVPIGWGRPPRRQVDPTVPGRKRP